VVPVLEVDEERYANGWWRRDRTFLDDFLEVTSRTPEKVAVVAPSSAPGQRVSLTFGELRGLVDRIALRLLARGIGPGEVVSYQLPNWWEFTAVTLACARAGATANPIAPILRQREVGYILGALESRLCLVPNEFRGFSYAGMMQELRAQLPASTEVVVLGAPAGSGWCSFEEDFTLAPPGPAADLDERRRSPNDVAQVQFTSGTTGHPKGVVHTYNTLYASYRALIEGLGLTPDDVVLVPSTMAHQTGFLNGCVMPMAEGMKVVYQDRWDADAMLSLIEREGVTYTSGAAPFLADACAAFRERPRDVSTLRFFRSGGAPIRADLVREASELLGIRVAVSWGMTENGICTLSRTDSTPDEVAATDGYPLPWVQLRVAGGDGSVDEGVLKVLTASQCVDYVPNHDDYAASFDADGYFDTGDLARINPDGSLRITGRVKEMIIRGGENVPVVEVENALAELPAVREVAVVGVPDARLGERACAVVVRELSEPELDLGTMQQHLRSLGMAPQFWPEYLVFRDTLPTTSAGKLRKAELRDSVVADLELES
jgi:cyclohexanecarboxylate-CoA ligase